MKVALWVIALVATANAFSPAARNACRSPLFQKSDGRKMALGSAISMAPLSGPPNPYKQLPWNVEKERKREARRLKHENAELHRELGIAEDATYEEIASATDALIAKAEGDIKKKIKIEVARDKIYQIRLNERIAGMSTETEEAKAQSRVEVGDSEDVSDIVVKKRSLQSRLPFANFFEGIIVKPDEAYRRRQISVFGIMTLLGFLLPPLVEQMSVVAPLAAGGQMGYRGMPGLERTEGYNPFRGKRNKKHQLQAIALAIVIWCFAKAFAHWVLSTLKVLDTRMGAVYSFAIINVILGFCTAYIQTYKGEEAAT